MEECQLTEVLAVSTIPIREAVDLLDVLQSTSLRTAPSQGPLRPMGVCQGESRQGLVDQGQCFSTTLVRPHNSTNVFNNGNNIMINNIYNSLLQKLQSAVHSI